MAQRTGRTQRLLPAAPRWAHQFCSASSLCGRLSAMADRYREAVIGAAAACAAPRTAARAGRRTLLLRGRRLLRFATSQIVWQYGRAPQPAGDHRVRLRISRSLEAAARHQRRRTRSRRRHTSHPLQRSPPLHCKSIPAHRDEQHCTVGAQQNNKIKARCLLRRLTMFLLSWNYVGLSIEEHCRAASGVSTTIASSAAGTVCASADSDGEHAVVAHASLRGGRVTSGHDQRLGHIVACTRALWRPESRRTGPTRRARRRS